MTEEITQKELARRLGITPRAVRKLGDRIPRNPAGKYPWPEAKEAHDKIRTEEELRKLGVHDLPTYKELRARKLLAETERVEFELAARKSEMIHIDDLEELLLKPLERVNGLLKSAPSSHGPALASAAGIDLPRAIQILGDISEMIRADLRAIADVGDENDRAELRPL